MPNPLQTQLAAPGAAASKTPKKPLRTATDATGDGPETDPKPPAKKIMSESGAFSLKPAAAKRKSA
jgi:hypothetical protein